MNPRISVIVSSYDDRARVPRKLRDLERQTLFPEAEFLFVETGSPGRERELFLPFCATHPNCRLLTTADRRTLFAAWNLGWQAARAPLVCQTNMDDAMHPRLLAEVCAGFAAHRWEVASVLIAEQPADDPALDDWSPARLGQLPLSTRPGPFTAWRRELLESFGRFDDQLAIAGDRDFWARAAAHGLRLGLLPRVLYLYTRHARQLSGTGPNDPRRQHDQQRLAAKPYPPHWPPGWRWKIRWHRAARRIWPERYYAAA